MKVHALTLRFCWVVRLNFPFSPALGVERRVNLHASELHKSSGPQALEALGLGFTLYRDLGFHRRCLGHDSPFARWTWLNPPRRPGRGCVAGSGGDLLLTLFEIRSPISAFRGRDH